MKKFYYFFACVIMLTGTAAFTSCDNKNEGKEPLAKPTVTLIGSPSTTATSITVKVNPDVLTKKIYYYAGKLSDKDAFAAGTLEGIKESPISVATEFTIDGLTPKTEYVFFVMGENSEGLKSDVIYATATTIEAPQLSIASIKTTHSLAFTITPNNQTASFKYAFGVAADETDFTSGAMAGLEEATSEVEVVYDILHPGTEYILFTMLYGKSGEEELIKTAVSTESGPGLSITISDIGIPTATITSVPNEYCTEYYISIVSKEILNSLAETYEERVEIAELLVMSGAAYYDTVAAEEIWELNGYADYENFVITLSYDSDSNFTYEEFEFTSASINPSLELPGNLTISLVANADNSAEISFTPGQNTVGFYYGLYPKEGYDELYQAGEASEDTTGEQYVIDYTAFYGYTSFEATSEIWNNLTANVDYVVVGVPFNANGADHQYGYGTTTLFNFTAVGIPPEPEPAPGILRLNSANNTKKAISNEVLLSVKRR